MATNKLKKYISTKSDVQKFRDKWYKKGFELINITTLCRAEIGGSGWINDINEPDETSHHVKLWYRDEIVANMNGNKTYVIDDDKYVIYISEHYDSDFILNRKVKI